MKLEQICEGVNLYSIHSKKFNSVVICVLIRQQLDRAQVTTNALISQILQRGCEKYKTSKEIYAHCEHLYGADFDVQIIKKGEQQIIQLFCECLKSQFENALEFLKEIIFNPLCENECFNEEYTLREKENLKQSILSRVNNKSEYSKLRLLEEMCKDEPFSIYADGYLEDLDKIDNCNSFKQYKKILESSPIDIIILGDVKEKSVIDILKQDWFIKERKNIVKINSSNIINSVESVNNVSENKNSSQCKLAMGFRTGVEPLGNKYLSLVVGNEIFGGSATSKLFKEIREKESLCYSIYSFMFRFKGIMVLQAGIEKEDVEKVIKMSLDELEKTKNGNFTTEELENAKINVVKKLETLKDYQSSTIDFHITNALLGETKTIEEIIKGFEKVKKEDILKALSNIKLDTIYSLK